MLRRAVVALVAACAAAGNARNHDAYVASLVERCEPPRVGLRAWALRELREASRGPARAAIPRLACALDACFDAPGGPGACALLPLEAFELRLAAARAALAPRASADAAPSTLAAPLLLDCVLGAFREPALRAAARLFLGLALGRRGDLAGAAREYRSARVDAAAAAGRGSGAGPGLVDAVDVQLGAVLVAAGGDGRDEGLALLRRVAKPAANASAAAPRAVVGFVLARLDWVATPRPGDWAAARYGGPAADEAARLGPLEGLGAADHAALGAALWRRGFGVAARRHFDLALALGDPLGAARALLFAEPVPAGRRWLAARLAALRAGLDGHRRGGAVYRCGDAFGAGGDGPCAPRTCDLGDVARALEGAPRLQELARSPDDDVDDLFAHPSVAREAPLLARAVAFALRECPPAGYGEAAAAPRPATARGAKVRVGFLSSRFRRGPAWKPTTGLGGPDQT